MTYRLDDQNWFMCLEKGESLQESFEAFLKETSCNSAWVQGIGAALSIELGFYHLETKQYHWQVFDGPREVLSLQGNIAVKDSQPVFHLHGTFGEANYQTVGGHVKELVAGATLELFIQPSQQPLTRQHDEATGLWLLQI